MDDARQQRPPAQAVSTQEADVRQALSRQYPTALHLRAKARRRMPKFSFEFMDGGAGQDTGIARNWSAFDGIEIMPRYGNVIAPPPVDTFLFGRPYAAPVGISPVGSPGTAFPGAERYLAKAAQEARVPYTLGVLGAIDVEEAIKIAPDVLWFQIYRFSRNEHKIGFDLVRRAQAAGAHALVLTIDTPVRTVRPREVSSGIVNPFKLTMPLRLQALQSPAWMAALAKSGIPRFVSLRRYMPGTLSLAESAAFIRHEQGGAFSWEEIARYRDVWKGPLVLKGVLHPGDAERAVSLGVEGLFVTNHGGRQIDALPTSIDALPAIRAAIGKKATLVLDSGVRSGVDVARAVACGADAAFAGKSFLWSLGALGERGPAHLINIYMDDLRASLGQFGCRNLEELAQAKVRHPTAWKPEEFV